MTETADTPQARCPSVNEFGHPCNLARGHDGPHRAEVVADRRGLHSSTVEWNDAPQAPEFDAEAVREILVPLRAGLYTPHGAGLRVIIAQLEAAIELQKDQDRLLRELASRCA